MTTRRSWLASIRSTRRSDAEPRAPRSIDPGVPVDLETIVLKALEKDPRRRYASAHLFAEDLARAEFRLDMRASE